MPTQHLSSSLILNCHDVVKWGNSSTKKVILIFFIIIHIFNPAHLNHQLLMYHIIYLSSAIIPFSDIELKELLVKARNFNSTQNITGILFYKEGYFLQAIEGNKERVISLFETIKKDKRHKNIITLFDEDIQSRSYPEWSMSYPDPKLEESAIPEGYDNLLNKDTTKYDLDNYSLKVRAFMRRFVA